MNQEYKKAYLLYHVCVFLWGFTAVFGKIIDLQETILVWWRMGITSLILLCIPALWKTIRNINKKTLLQLAGIGVLVTCHWISFYGSIKASNISVALTCLATTSFFVSVFEPLMFNKKFIWYELILAVLVIPAIYLIFHFSGSYTEGIILGLASTIFATLFSLLNKKMISKTAPLNITFIEIAVGFILLSVVLPFYMQTQEDIKFWPTTMDTVNLILFSALCTVVPFTLSLYCMRHISVFTASITLNLEPVYGIIMAIVFFNENEYLAPGFYIGTLLILLVVFINPFIQRRFGGPIKPPVTIGE
ncbi:MAG TPA: DMT family transporter [Chitinophagales bacterium]|nr:DMT family transporter [Chitinophagales bacterium]HRG27778.1 DMT family transporter [Chitinophagales bacterium]HRG85924.1 DMT family transporter [Chitinophagales bacterium]HRH51909.1 DMT family transporter [Chitinophagales bacterium]